MSPAQVKQNTKNERKVKKNIIIIGRTKPSNRMRMDFDENIRLETVRSAVIGGETKHKKMETIWKLWNSIEFFSSEEVSSIQSIWILYVLSFSKIRIRQWGGRGRGDLAHWQLWGVVRGDGDRWCVITVLCANNRWKGVDIDDMDGQRNKKNVVAFLGHNDKGQGGCTQKRHELE